MVWTPEERGSAPWPSGSPVLAEQLPAEAVDDAIEVGSQAAMLALAAQKGDIALRTDTGVAYVLAGTDPSVLANWKALGTGTSGAVEARTATGTSDTLVLADAGKVVRYSNASAVTATVPPNTDVAFATGTIINIYSAGAGGVTVAAGSGVTIRNNASGLAQYGECSLRKDGADEWVRTG